MARQLVFTSAPQGLTPGRTGYCTVARHRDMRDRLVTALESLSVFPSDWQPAPMVCTFRLVDVGGTRFPILSRIVSAGQDYTHRSRFLAHHLALDPEEVTGAPPPAEIFRRWPGWLNRWDGPPRWLDENDIVDLVRMRSSIPPALPAETWASLAGDAGCAALLVEGSQPIGRVLRCPDEWEGDILNLLSESSALLPPAESWRAEFTTCLQPSDSVSAFRWAAVRAGSPSEAILPRSSTVLDLSLPGSLPSVPDNVMTRRARGKSAPAPTPAAPATRTVISLASKVPTERNAVDTAAQNFPRLMKPRTAPLRRSNAWVWGALAGSLLGGVIMVVVLWPSNPAPSTPAATATPPPEPVYIAPKPDIITIPSPPPSQASTQPVTPANPATDQTAMEYEQKLSDITQLAGNGKALEALARWKDLSDAAPDFASAHATFLSNRLLPAARKEWLDALNQIMADLSTGKSSRADLAARLAQLRGFPQAWPVTNPAQLNRTFDAVVASLNFVTRLPDAPIWLVDNLASSGNGGDYQDATITLAIPELNALMAASADKFHVSAAPATSLELPAAGEWFNFNILPVDFDARNYLVLHDASRGAAGGRFMQLLVDKPGEVKLTWRIFQPNSDFFKRFATNQPLGPTSHDMWLHFAGEPPLPSFYLILHRLGGATGPNWKPLAAPMTWLDLHGSPARVSLPAWLANNLIMRSTSGQTFRLEPGALKPVEQEVTVTQDASPSAAGANYQVSRLVDQLNGKFREFQTDLARIQQALNEMQSTAATNPSKGKSQQPMIDEATKNVDALQADMKQVQDAAQAAEKTNWALSAGPWLLYYSHSAAEPMLLLEFPPNETGPSP